MARPDDWPADWPHPDDANGKPDGWRDVEWVAYSAGIIDPSMSYVELGHLVGRQKGTISSWVQKWRARYGPDFFKRARSTPIPPDKVVEGARKRGLDVSQGWAPVRSDAADGYAAGGWLTLQLSALVASEILDDPARRAELGPADVLQLARAGEIWTKVADRLANIPDPGRLTPGGQRGLDDGIPPDLLGGFDQGPGIPMELEGEDAVTMQAVEIGLAQATIRVQRRRGEVIDVDSSKS